MGITDLVSRLRSVRQTGMGRFIACCPAHEDKRPSMTVRELQDGRILMHCFAGCDTEAILNAVGLRFSDLFAEPLTRETLKPVRAPFSHGEALACLATESAVVAFCGAQLTEGKPLDAEDTSRLWLAAGRIATALEVCNGR